MNATPAQILGRRIRRERETRGLVQRQMAERLGLHVTAVSRVETGHRSLSADDLVAWASALGVRPSRLAASLDHLVTIARRAA